MISIGSEISPNEWLNQYNMGLLHFIFHGQALMKSILQKGVQKIETFNLNQHWLLFSISNRVNQAFVCSKYEYHTCELKIDRHEFDLVCGINSNANKINQHISESFVVKNKKWKPNISQPFISRFKHFDMMFWQFLSFICLLSAASNQNYYID